VEAAPVDPLLGEEDEPEGTATLGESCVAVNSKAAVIPDGRLLGIRHSVMLLDIELAALERRPAAGSRARRSLRGPCLCRLASRRQRRRGDGRFDWDVYALVAHNWGDPLPLPSLVLMPLSVLRSRLVSKDRSSVVDRGAEDGNTHFRR
jgi:hypothetical protein